MSTSVLIEEMDNGLCLIGEEIPGVESVAYELCIPGGVCYDPNEQLGLSLVLSEMIGKGAGPYDSRALSDEYDRLGIRHSEAVGQEKIVFRGICLYEDLERALELLCLTLTEPRLPESQLQAVKDLLCFDLRSLVDYPAQRSAIELQNRYFLPPQNRSPYGSMEGIESVSVEDLKALVERFLRPRGAVLSVAGKIDQSGYPAAARRIFSKWKGESVPRIHLSGIEPPFIEHLPEESAQVYLAMAFNAAPFSNPRYYAGRVYNEVMSGGMFGRLFLEARERRGLCYSIHSSYSANNDGGTFSVYAGTSPDRIDELYSVVIEELRLDSLDLSEQELARCRANLKSSLIMSEESSAARASANASDWWLMGRVRGVHEIEAAVESTDTDAVLEYLKAYPPHDFSVLTLGPSGLSQSRQGG